MVTGLQVLDHWAKGNGDFPNRLAVRNKMDELLLQEPKMLKMQLQPRGPEFAAWLVEGIAKAESFEQPEQEALLRTVQAKAKELGII